MKTEKDKSMFEEVNSILYEQAERLLNHVAKNLKGEKLEIEYLGTYCTSDSHCIISGEKVRLSFRCYSDPDSDSITITMSNPGDKKSYEISIGVSKNSPLYYLIPPSVIVGLRQCANMQEDVEVTL
ncbi:MAG: hypothetical protein JJE25_07525 [Bacteroidia bacterium]|nr:hypothetical protein [Bacteroidia bacterium]